MHQHQKDDLEGHYHQHQASSTSITTPYQPLPTAPNPGKAEGKSSSGSGSRRFSGLGGGGSGGGGGGGGSSFNRRLTRLAPLAIFVVTLFFITSSTLFSLLRRDGNNSSRQELAEAASGLREEAAAAVQQKEGGATSNPHGGRYYNGTEDWMRAGTSALGLSRSQAHDRTMSDLTCREEFPRFYPQLEELGKYWRARGGLNVTVIDQLEKEVSPVWGYSRVVIREGKIHLRSFEEGLETRNSALLLLLTRAINTWPSASPTQDGSSSDDLPPIDLILSAGDKDAFTIGGGWTVAKNMYNEKMAGSWLMPDFGFIAWPEAGAGKYEDFLDLAAEVEKRYPFEKKYDKIFWRGYAGPYPNRLDMLERTSAKKDPARSNWADVHETTFHHDDGDFYPLVTLPDHCQHKYLLHTEGNSYSGRSKYLFSCNSVTVAHPMEWTQHFHPALNPDLESPNQNYIQLPGLQFNGLEAAVKELRRADSDGSYRQSMHTYTGSRAPKEVAENAARTLRDRYLTPAATMCYLRAALREYAASLDTRTWGPNGIVTIPGQGIMPGSSKNSPMKDARGDLEVDVWRLLGSPDWPQTSQIDKGPTRSRIKAM